MIPSLRRRMLLQGAFNPLQLRPRLLLDAYNEAIRRALISPKLIDGFDRANGSLGSAPTGQAYSVVSGTWSIASGTARTALTDSLTLVLFGATMADGRISLRTRTTSTLSVGQIALRAIDNNNYLVVRRGTGGVVIGKVDGGVSSSLATAGAGLSANVWDVLEVRFAGNQIDAYLNGTLTTQYTLTGADATKFGATTGIGMARNGATSATVEFDDITVSSGASSLLLDKWSDDSGNGFDFSQATATKQPLLTWSVSASGLLVPVVRFDGVDDLLVRSAIDVSSSLVGHLHIALARATSSATSAIFSSSDEAVGVRFASFGLDASAKMLFDQRNSDTEDTLNGATALTTNTPYLIDFESDSTAYTGSLNGASQSLTATSGSNTGDWFGTASLRDSFAIGANKKTAEGQFAAIDAQSIILLDSTVGGNLLPLDRYNSQRYGMGISV